MAIGTKNWYSAMGGQTASQTTPTLRTSSIAPVTSRTAQAGRGKTPTPSAPVPNLGRAIPQTTLESGAIIPSAFAGSPYSELPGLVLNASGGNTGRGRAAQTTNAYSALTQQQYQPEQVNQQSQQTASTYNAYPAVNGTWLNPNQWFGGSGSGYDLGYLGGQQQPQGLSQEQINQILQTIIGSLSTGGGGGGE